VGPGILWSTLAADCQICSNDIPLFRKMVQINEWIHGHNCHRGRGNAFGTAMAYAFYSVLQGSKCAAQAGSRGRDAHIRCIAVGAVGVGWTQGPHGDGRCEGATVHEHAPCGAGACGKRSEPSIGTYSSSFNLSMYLAAPPTCAPQIHRHPTLTLFHSSRKS
jgi:hypothetical protein